jgi:hypothetical protein
MSNQLRRALERGVLLYCVVPDNRSMQHSLSWVIGQCFPVENRNVRL